MAKNDFKNRRLEKLKPGHIFVEALVAAIGQHLQGKTSQE
jgi:hypothetical protein